MLPAEAYDEYVLGMTNANKNAGTDSENEVIEKEFEAEYISSSVNNLKPLVDKGKRYCKLLNRGEIVFSIAVEAQTKYSQHNTINGATKDAKAKKKHILVVIKATNTRTKDYAIIDADCFKSSLDILAIEIRNLELAIESGKSYTIPTLHDPLRLFFDHTFEYGFITYPYKDILSKKSTGAQSLKIRSLMSPHKNVGAMNVTFINKHETSSMEVGKELSFGIEIQDIVGLEINANKILCRASFVNHQEFVTDFVDSDEHGIFRINSFQQCHIEKLSHKYIEDLNMTQLLLIICVNVWKPTTEGPQIISTSSREIIESMKCERDIAETNGDEVLLAKRILNYKEQNKTLKLDLANMKKTWEDSVETMHKEHDKTVSENKIAMHKLISNFKTQMEKQVVDAKNVERKQQQQIKVLTTKIETLNQQHNQKLLSLEKEKQQLANKATIEVKSLQDAHKDLMQQHQSDIGHLLSQHKNELEESVKMRDAEILKVREELAEERKTT